MTLQERINQAFVAKFKNYAGGLNLSVPYIPRISDNYLKTRTIVLGQETNTWYPNGQIDGLKTIFHQHLNNVDEICLKKRYDKFIKSSVGKYPGKFWEFQRLLYAEHILQGQMIQNNQLSHCWLNLFAIEACKNKKDDSGRPTKNKILADKIMKMQQDLLFELFEILQPETIFSLTGHSLDQNLLKFGIKDLNATIKSLDPLKILSANELGRIEVLDKDHPLYGKKIIRTYHPTYFLARINTNKALKTKLSDQNINLTNSKYYLKTLLNHLRK